MSNPAASAFPGVSGPLLFAHRGARLEFPENTLPAFERALELGADVLELDVHTTRDGQVVVCHDPDLREVAGVPRRIADMEYEELRHLPLRRPQLESGAPVYVPLLSQVLREFPSAAFNVDIKLMSSLIPTLSVVAAQDASSRVLLTSFFSSVTRRLRWGSYPGATGLGREEALMASVLPLRALPAAQFRGRRIQIPTRARGLRLDRPELIRKFHALGLAVDYWVINDAGQARELLAAGADGIITDDPRRMRTCFESAPEAAPWRKRHACP